MLRRLLLSSVRMYVGVTSHSGFLGIGDGEFGMGTKDGELVNFFLYSGNELYS